MQLLAFLWTMPKVPQLTCLQLLLDFRDKQIIKVINCGPGCDKSSMLSLWRDALVASGVEEDRFVFINLEEPAAEPFSEPKTLHGHIKSRLVKGQMVYVLFRGIEQVRDFPRVLASLLLQEGLDLYVICSGDFAVDTPMATLLTGRYVEIKTPPLDGSDFDKSRGAF